MSKHLKYIEMAAAVSRYKEDGRRFYLGALGIRADGTIVFSANGNPKMPDRKHHAEYRVSRKLDAGSLVYVCRTIKEGEPGSEKYKHSAWAMAKPCPDCLKVLSSRAVRSIYYSISTGEYGCIELR